MWDAVSLTGEKNWVHGITNDLGTGNITEGQKDKWAQRKAIEYMKAHPVETLRRSLIKFADFWGLEREFMAGVQQGMYSPPVWFSVLASAAILAAYALIAIVGAAGIWIAAPHDKRLHAMLLLPVIVLIVGTRDRVRTFALSLAAHPDLRSLRGGARRGADAVLRALDGPR